MKTNDTIFSSIVPAIKRSSYPLSSAQKRMYFLYEFDKGSTGYNIPSIFELGSDVDLDLVALSIKGLVSRHESLRTRFVFESGDLVQQVGSAEGFDLEYHRGTRASANDLIDAFVRPFDLSILYPFRAGLIELAEGGSLLILDM